VFVSPTVVGKAVIIGSCSGSLYSLDRTTGKPIWLYDTGADGPRAEFHGEPLLLGDRVVIPTDTDPKGHLYSFDTASGELVWKVPFAHGVATTPLLIDDRIVVVSAQGDVAAIEPKSGKVLWRVAPAGVLKTIPFIVSPARAAGRVLIADNTNQILALSSRDGATLWRRTLSGRATTSLVVIGEHVIVGTTDRYLNWIAVKTGEVKKRVQLGGIPYGTPVSSGALLLVLVSSVKSKLVALDAATGAVRWGQETPKEWTTYRPLVAGSVVIVGNDDKDLCAFDRASGKRRWCRPVGQTPRGLGISRDGILYVGSLSGVVQAFRISSADTRSR
jgi:outer membrane protein assembly factor BamB